MDGPRRDIVEGASEKPNQKVAQSSTVDGGKRRLGLLRDLLHKSKSRAKSSDSRKQIVKERLGKIKDRDRRLAEITGPISKEDLRLFSDLRDSLHSQVREELKRRIVENLNPTEQELSAGVFIESIEPQCRDAVVAMREKGYSTSDTGFSGLKHCDQFVAFTEPVSDDTRNMLQEQGVHVVNDEVYGLTVLVFRPKAADFETVREDWDRVAGLLPDLGKKPDPSRSASRFAEDPVGLTQGQ